MFSNFHKKDELLLGLKTAASIVASTLGPRGNVVFINENGYVRPTKDGVTVARSLAFREAGEDCGRALLVQAASQTVGIAGDGTTTTSVMLNEFCEVSSAGWADVNAKESEIGAIEEALDSLRVDIESESDMVAIATVSANNDKVIGEKVGKMIWALGKNAQVQIKESLGTETQVDLVEGCRYDRGLVIKTMGNIVLDRCYVLVTDHKIRSQKTMQDIAKAYNDRCMVDGTYPLVIVCDDMEGAASAIVGANLKEGSIKIIPVLAPSYGEERNDMLNDIVRITGASKIYSSTTGSPLRTLDRNGFGVVDGFMADRKTTTFVCEESRGGALAKRVEEVQSQIDKSSSQTEKDHHKKRLSALTSGFGTVSIKADSEADFNRVKDVYEDAILCCVSALREGAVPGGGVALGFAAQKVNDELLRNVLLAPMKIIYGDEYENALRLLRRGMVLDVVTGDVVPFGDCLIDNIADSLEVVKQCLRNSYSVWKNIALSNENIIVKYD